LQIVVDELRVLIFFRSRRHVKKVAVEITCGIGFATYLSTVERRANYGNFVQ
jgi:hypothetical protein